MAETTNLLSGFSAYGNQLGVPQGDVNLTAGAWRATQAPALWSEWARWAEELARQGARASLSAFAEGQSADFAEAERMFMEQAVSQGLSPETAALQWGAVGPRWEQAVAAQRFQSEANLATDIRNIGTSATQAIQSSIDYQDSLDQQEYWNRKLYKLAKKQGKLGALGQIAGLGLTAWSLGAGAPAAAQVASAAASGGGGGGSFAPVGAVAPPTFGMAFGPAYGALMGSPSGPAPAAPIGYGTPIPSAPPHASSTYLEPAYTSGGY